MSQQILTRFATHADIPEVIDLIAAQEQRLHRLDPRLRVAHSHEQIAVVLEQHLRTGEKPLVALNEQGQVKGYAQPSIWRLPPESELLAFFTSTNGTMSHLILPPPNEEDTDAIMPALLIALTDCWQAQGTMSDVLRWPSCDYWFEPLLKAVGFMVDSDLAYHPPQSLISARRPASPLLQTRLARRDDEEALVELFEEELRFHQPYTPFVHVSPSVISAFRSRLARLWVGETLADGAPQVVVVEQGNRVVAMAENDLLFIKHSEEPDILPTGCYGHLNNVSVRKDMRGQGVGHTLVQAVFDLFAPIRLDGYLLYFNPDNPLAHSFWSHLGFLPVLRTYQRPVQRQEKN